MIDGSLIGKEVWVYDDDGKPYKGEILCSIKNKTMYRIVFRKGNRKHYETYNYYPDEIGKCVFFSRKEMLNQEKEIRNLYLRGQSDEQEFITYRKGGMDEAYTRCG